MTRMLILTLAIATLTFSVGACNTMKGMGRDVEAGGEHLNNAATDVQTNMHQQ